MSHSLRTLLAAATLAAAATFTGCKEQEPPPPPAISDVPKNLDGAFATANPESRAAVKSAMDALKNDEQANAIEALEALTKRSDLTPEQRQAAAVSALAVRQQIMEAANKGDEAAKAFLEQQRARK